MTHKRVVVGVCTFVALVAASVFAAAPTPARAQDPPPPPPAPLPIFTCEGEVHATPQERDDFAVRWGKRLQGTDPLFNLEQYLDPELIPPDLTAEVGFTAATTDTPTRACLILGLFDHLKAQGDPTFGMDTSQNPPVPFSDDTVMSALGMMVFRDVPKQKPIGPEPVPGVPIELPDPVTDALNALGLNQLQNITVPTITVPGNLGLPILISKVINDLVNQLHGPLLPALPPLGNLIQLPALPGLPPIPKIDLPSLTDIINLARSVIDSTTYTVCYRGAKTNGTIKCTNSVIGLPVLLDVQGDAAPDLTVRLGPFVNPDHPAGLTMSFTVDRLVSLSAPLDPPPPVSADVTATWDVPATSVRAHLGFGSTFKQGLSLARHSEFLATLTNLQDASNGNPNIAYTITQEPPEPESLVIAGVSQLLRSGSATGTTTVPEATAAYLHFVGVPQTTKGNLNIQTKPTTTADDPFTARYLAAVNTSSPTLLTLGIVRRYTASDPAVPCCPMQSFSAVADKLPTTLTLDIKKYDAANKWAVGYTGNATVGRLSLFGADYPNQTAFAAPPAQQTVKSFSAEVKQVPTKVDVVATMPIPKANPRFVDVSYKGSLATDPNAIVVVPSVDLGTIEKVDGDVQRSFKGHAEDVPGRIHVVANMAGDALNTPPGKNLDVDLTYDSSSTAKNLTVDFFDKGEKSTSKLSGTIATLPPWFNAKVGSHPTNDSVVFNAKTAADAADGSAALGTVNLKYAKNAEFLALGASTPQTNQYAVVVSGYGSDKTDDTDDDTVAIEAKYTGLKQTNVSLEDDGLTKGNLTLDARVLNDDDRSMTVRFDSPKSNINAEVRDVPQDVTVHYERRRTGTLDDCGEPETTHKVVYDAVDVIDRAKVTVQGKRPDANPDNPPVLDPNSLVIVEAGSVNGAGHIPKHMELFANSATKRVNYRANGTIGQVAASILDASPTCGDRKGINVDLRGLPQQFGAAIDPEKLRFTDLADTTTAIELVQLNEDQAVATAVQSVAVAFTDHPAGAVPDLPTTNKLSVLSDKRGAGSIAASVRLEGVKLFKLNLVKEDPGDPDSKTINVNADLQLAAELSGVGVRLDFIDKESEQAQVTGAINKLAPTLHLDLNLVEDATRVQFQTPGGHLDTNLVIGLGTFGFIEQVVLPAQRPVGVMLRDTQACLCAKKVGILMLGAPSSLDLRVDKIKTEQRGDQGDADPFLVFSDYQPPGGSTDLSIDVALLNQAQEDNKAVRDPARDLLVEAVLHAVPSGYGVTVRPIATGNPLEPTAKYFDMVIQANKAIGSVDLEVATGVPAKKNPDGTSTPFDPAPCSACNLHLTGTISNLPPSFHFLFKSGPPAPGTQRKDTTIQMVLDGPNGAPDDVQTIGSVKLNVLMWQFKPDTQEERTEPQLQLDLRDIPDTMEMVISDGVKKDDTFAQPCVEQPNTLPGINYTASGNKRDELKINATIDTVMLSDDPKNPDKDAAVVDAGVTNLAHSLKFENKPDGEFKLTQPDAPTTKTGNIHIEVSAQTMKILNWTLQGPPDGCGFSKTFGPLKIESAGGIGFNLRTGIVLDVNGLKNVTLKPGIITKVNGSYDKVTFGLRNPKLVDGYLSGVGMKATVRISSSIQPSISLVYPPVHKSGVTFPVSINFINLGISPEADWIDINLIVPCDVDFSWSGVDIDSYHAVVKTMPGIFAEFSNGFEALDSSTARFIPAPAGVLEDFKFWVKPLVTLLSLIFFQEGGFSAGIECPD